MELLGSYDPHKKTFKVKRERVEHWLSQGAQISPTVNNLMVNYKVWDKPKMESWKPKVKPKQESVAKPASPKAPEKAVEEKTEVVEEKVEAVEVKEEVAPAVE